MRLGLIADTPEERNALESGQVPVAFLETHYAFGLARAVMAATRLGVFESLAHRPASAVTIARSCGTDPVATQKLLISLAGSGYLDVEDDQYALTPTARACLLKGNTNSLVDTVLFAFDEWDLMEHIEDYVRSGSPLDLHQCMTREQWERYQQSMRALAGQTAQQVAQAISLPDGASDMMDVGGSHGYYSVAL